MPSEEKIHLACLANILNDSLLCRRLDDNTLHLMLKDYSKLTDEFIEPYKLQALNKDLLKD